MGLESDMLEATYIPECPIHVSSQTVASEPPQSPLPFTLLSQKEGLSEVWYGRLASSEYSPPPQHLHQFPIMPYPKPPQMDTQKCLPKDNAPSSPLVPTSYPDVSWPAEDGFRSISPSYQPLTHRNRGARGRWVGLGVGSPQSYTHSKPGH
jgi:hypothetical protein